MKIIRIILLVFFILPVLYFHPIFVLADDATSTIPVPVLSTPTSETTTFDTNNGISSLIKIIIWWAFRLAGVLAFAMIVYAGFQYIVSGGNTAQQKDAQERIMNAIIGLVLLFAFYIILYTINPDILKSASDTTTLPSSEITQGTTTEDQATLKNLVNIRDMGIPINDNTFGQSEAYLDSALSDKLLSLKNIEPKWWVNDACIDDKCNSTSYTPRRADDCHLDGTCVDIDSVSNNSNDNRKIIAEFNKAGLAVLNEGNHLHVALMEATGYGSYPGSDYCITQGCWYGAI